MLVRDCNDRTQRTTAGGLLRVPGHLGYRLRFYLKRLTTFRNKGKAKTQHCYWETRHNKASESTGLSTVPQRHESKEHLELNRWNLYNLTCNVWFLKLRPSQDYFKEALKCLADGKRSLPRVVPHEISFVCRIAVTPSSTAWRNIL